MTSSSIASAAGVGPHPVIPRRLALMLLAALLLVLAAVGLVLAADLPRGTAVRLGAGAMPQIMILVMALAAVMILLQSALTGSGDQRRWPPWAVALIAVLAALLFYGNVLAFIGGLLIPLGETGLSLALRLVQWLRSNPILITQFGPADSLAATVLVLTLAIAAVRYSRPAGLGMLALGGLLGLAGTDVNTGTLRLTLGLSDLADGIGLMPLALGILPMAEGVVAMASPAIWLGLTRHALGLKPSGNTPTSGGSIGLRVAGAMVVLFSAAIVYPLQNLMFDVGLAVLFGVFGIAAKLCGWNRWLVIAGFVTMPLLEVYLRRALLLSRGDLVPFFTRPISGGLFALTMCITLGLATMALVRFSKGRSVPHLSA